MNIAEILQAKDLRIQVLEEQLTACKSDRKRLKKQLKLYVVSFCLPLKDQHFDEWLHTNFTEVKDGFEAKVNTTISYSKDQILENN